MLHFPQNLRLIRLLSGKSQTDFGMPFDATKAMMVSYEKGKANPDELFLSRLSRYSGVSEQDLKNKKLKEEDIKIGEEEEKEEKVSPRPKSATVSSLERTLENLSEDKLKSTAIIERLVTLLEKQLGGNPGPQLVAPGTRDTIQITKGKNEKTSQ